MELLTKELRMRLPPLYAQQHADDPMVHIKYFTPDSSWTWYVTEGSEEEGDFIFFGYVVGMASEWGYFSLRDLSSVHGPMHLPIERDLFFEPKAFSKIAEIHGT